MGERVARARARFPGAVAALLALLLALGACSGADGVTVATTTTAGSASRFITPRNPLRVLLLGDSLAWEAKSVFTDTLEATGRAVADVMAFGGTAYCTFDDALREYVVDERPEVVVIEFSGNSLGPCMTDPETDRPYAGDRLVDVYEEDARGTVRYLRDRGIAVYLSTFPESRAPHAVDDDLRDLVREVAGSEPGVRLVDAAAAVEAPDGSYAEYLPCLPDEPCTDRDPDTGRRAARVRAPDGAHFCPNGLPAVAGVTLECEVWSSGAWRFGTALAEAVIDDHGL